MLKFIIFLLTFIIFICYYIRAFTYQLHTPATTNAYATSKCFWGYSSAG